MNQKALLIVFIVVIGLAGLVFLEISQGAISGLIFDQISYNYTSKVWIPPKDASASPTSPQGSSLGGYYQVDGKGRNFNLHLVLSGAEKTESPLDYTKDGLRATGHISDIHVTWNTINYLLRRQYQQAVMNTRFKGYMNMTCAAWNGTTSFHNSISNFTGSFTITGTMTDWEGTYQIQNQQGHMVLIGDYIYYPHGNKQASTINRVQKSFYIS
ncbi:MAG: hypothetical protein BME94_00305 [Methanobacteriales archaeon Met13]